MLPYTERPYYNEKTYLDLLRTVQRTGEERENRTDTDTVSIFGPQAVYELGKGYGFPVLTSKRIYWKGIVGELLWFLRGETNVRSLQEDGISFWDEWADEDGNLGPVYGYQWRNFPRVDWDDGDPSLAGFVDQVDELMTGLKNDPNSRRHIVCAWNPGMRHEMALPPCHAFFQFYIREGKYLDCQLYQRSADMFLGVPFNIASYSLLTAIIAMKLDLEPGKFYHTMGDAHIYVNHLEQTEEQLTKRACHPAPSLWIDPSVKDMEWDDMKIEHFKLENYKCEARLDGEIAT